jgi:hypothetical protein
MSNPAKVFYCQLCEKTWDQLPPDAVPLTNFGGHGRANTYKFADGTIHIITRKAQSAGRKET